MIRQSLISYSSIKPIVQLARRCETFDGYSPKFYWDFLKFRRYDPKALDYIYCLSSEPTSPLIALLSVYYFQNNIEIVAMVDPDFRHQGIFTQLLKKALDFLRSDFQTAYLLVCNAKAVSLNAKYATNNGNLHHSEIEMEGPKDMPFGKTSPLPLVLLPSGIADIEVLINLHQASFSGTSLETIRERFNLMLRDANRQVWLAKDLHGKAIGKLHVRKDCNAIFLHDVCIIPELQQQGYGRSLLYHWYQMHPAPKDKSILVDVLADNQSALGLYHACGFTIKNQYNFWQFKL